MSQEVLGGQDEAVIGFGYVAVVGAQVRKHGPSGANRKAKPGGNLRYMIDFFVHSVEIFTSPMKSKSAVFSQESDAQLHPGGNIS